MGNRAIHNTNFGLRSRWQSLGMSHSAELLRNTTTGQQVEKYLVDGATLNNFEVELTVYELRMHELTGCVRVLYYSLEKAPSICGSPDIFIVLTERTDRLSDVGRISLRQAKILLRDCLEGFDQLFQVFGLFNIQQSFIGLNEKGRGKVWLNSIFGINTIDEEPTGTNTEQKQIRRLVGILQRKIALEQLPIDFGTQILRAQTLQEAAWIIDQRQHQIHNSKTLEQHKSRITENPLVKELKRARIQQLEDDKNALQHYHDQTRQNYKPVMEAPPKVHLNKIKLPDKQTQRTKVSLTTHREPTQEEPIAALERKQSTPQLHSLSLDQTFGHARHHSKGNLPDPSSKQPHPLHLDIPSCMTDSLVYRTDMRGDRLRMIPQVDSMLVIQEQDPQRASRVNGVRYVESRVRTHN